MTLEASPEWDPLLFDFFMTFALLCWGRSPVVQQIAPKKDAIFLPGSVLHKVHPHEVDSSNKWQ